MTAEARIITPDDILAFDEYSKRRWEFRKKLAEIRKARRVEVGPFLSLSFECYDTMWHQIQEMLYIEKGGDEQLADELAAYNPLIPQGNELVATMMIEIDEPKRRIESLLKLGGIERAIALRFGDEVVMSRPEEDVERTKESGQTSSVHFLHFQFTPDQIATWRMDGTEVMLAVTHPEYRHMTVLSDTMRMVLAEDFGGLA